LHLIKYKVYLQLNCIKQIYKKMKKQSIAVLNILGISSASLCLVHCLLFPILSIIPLGFSNNHWIDVFFACIGMFVVSKIVMSKTSKKIKLVLFVSIIIVIIGVVLEIIWGINTKMVLIGGIGMIIGHLLNYKSHSK
jgi:hypothetical protein